MVGVQNLHKLTIPLPHKNGDDWGFMDVYGIVPAIYDLIRQQAHGILGIWPGQAVQECQ